MKSAWILLALAGFGAAAEREHGIRFLKDDLGKLPPGWKAARTGKGMSEWKVVKDEAAPGQTGYALAQTSDDPKALFNLCVVDEPILENLEVMVAFKAVKGQKDQGGGIVWRYQDADN